MENILKNYIAEKGMISISEFMQICLSHPTHGYYMKSEVFGKDGDFTTAPEISQMFGEIIGLWLVDAIGKMPKSDSYNLIELGPGRGTLMADILRAMSRFKKQFKLEIHMVEMSEKLIRLQQENLAEFANDIVWHKNLDDLKDDMDQMPSLFIANEFFDALPISQFEYLDDRWFERMVDVKDDKVVPTLSMKPVEPNLPDLLKNRAADGVIFEESPASVFYLNKISDILKINQGLCLIIDYGHNGHGFGDTLQAVKEHKYSKIFENLGEQDITAHVNFSILTEAAKKQGLIANPVTTQAKFLNELAISLRAQMLIRKNPDKEIEITEALNRLVGEDQMGNLFKVLCIQNINENDFIPAGFGLE